jgi:hypothetical protein
MKALRSFAVAILVVALPGCAATSTSTRAVASSDSQYDTEYMAKVEQASRGRGVLVQWINPPLKRDRPKDDDKRD